jgi:uncharacterized protein YbjT (DUF2867 family)
LVEGGVRAVAHVRPDSGRLDEWRETFGEWGAEVDETPWDVETMSAMLGHLQPDIVFGLVGTTLRRARAAQKATGTKDTYESVDYGLTKLLVDACRKAAVGPRFVYLSAYGTNAKAATAYGKARYKAEQAVVASGLPYVIVRPCIISGPGRDDIRLGEHVGAVVGDGLLGLAGLLGARKLGQRYASITDEALARNLIRVAQATGDGGLVVPPEELVR